MLFGSLNRHTELNYITNLLKDLYWHFQKFFVCSFQLNLVLIGLNPESLQLQSANMSKKRYVRKSEVVEKPPPEDLAKSKAKMGNFDSDEDQQSFQIELDSKQILHLWLVEVLPGSKFARYKLKLNEKKIVGYADECQKKLSQCKAYIENHVMKSIYELDIQFNKEFYKVMDLKFGAKIFNKQVIMKACQELTTNYKYNQALECIEKKFNIKSYFYLISLGKSHDQMFSQWYKQFRNANFNTNFLKQKGQKISQSTVSLTKVLPTHSKSSSTLIDPKRNGEQKQSYSAGQSSEEQQSPMNFYSYYQPNDKTKNTSKLSTSRLMAKIPATNENSEENKRKYRKKKEEEQIPERKIQKQPPIFDISYSKNIFDLDAFKRWIKNNRDLRIDQFQFTSNENGIKISLTPQSNKENKLKAVKIYLQFSRAILLEKVSYENQKKIEQKYCQKNQSHLSCRIIEGYMEPGTHEHRIRTAISQGKINKTDRRNKKFSAAYLVGLNPFVEKLQEQIRNFISELPKDDKVEHFVLKLSKIEDYLYEDKVRVFIEKVIAEHVKKYDHLTFISLNFPVGNNVSLKLSIKYNQYDEFMRTGKDKLIQSINENCFESEELLQEHDINNQLLDKYILLKSAKNLNKYVLISQKSKALEQVKLILSYIHQGNTKLESTEIDFKKGRYIKLKSFIEEIEKDQNLALAKKNIKLSFQGETKLTIYGTYKHTKQVSMIIEEYLNKLNDSVIEKAFQVTETEANVIQKNMKKFSQEIENGYKLSFILSRNVDLGAVFSLRPDQKESPLKITVQKNKNFEKIDDQTLICCQNQRELNFFNHKSLTEIKAYFHVQLKQALSMKKHFDREIMFLYSQGFTNVENLVKAAVTNYPFPAKLKKFVFIMPTDKKSQFIASLLISFGKLTVDNNIQVTVYQQSGEDLKKSLANVKDLYTTTEKTVQYYVFDKVEYYYSKDGDAKIHKALQKKEKFVYLTNQDLNLNITTHQCYLNDCKIRHIQSGIETQLTHLPYNRYVFTLRGVQFEIPKKQIDKVINQGKKNQVAEISVGAYELDLVKMKQVNLFSNFTRDLQKKQIITSKPNANLIVNFDEQINQVEIEYEPKDQLNAKNACLKLKSLIQQQRIKESHTLQKAITKVQYENLKQSAQEVDVLVEWDGDKTLNFSSFEKNSIMYLIKNIKLFIEELKQVKYPSTWVDQKSEIQTFVVDPNSKQFKDIQMKFTIGNIKELIRIQNTLVYKKYEDERSCLTALNGGKAIKEMNLFHGTRQTDPKMIYEDKEECFNINYTSDSNYLGRGTYFAERPDYSHNYAYTTQQGGILGFRAETIRQMFFCAVLIGDSQQVDQKSYSGNIRDTDYKNQAEKIRYESTTTFTNGSTIYAVYKNRRAYPHYLIKY